MTTIQSRHDTAENWTTNNPILAEGEIGVDTTNNIIKIGDGITAWNRLSYPKVMTHTPFYSSLGGGIMTKIDYPANSTDVSTSFMQKQNILSAGNGLLSDQLSEIEPLNNNFTVTTDITRIFNQSNYWAGLRVVVQIPVSESGYTIIGQYSGIYVEVRSDSFKIGYGTGTKQYGLQTINNAPGDYVQLTINYYNHTYVSSVSYKTQSGYGSSVSIDNAFNDNGYGYISGTSGVTISYIKLYKFNALAVDTSIVPTLSGTNNFTGTLQYSGTEVAKADASNFTSAGTTTLSSYGMPSTRYTNLTLGDSGTAYTAPANGWVCVHRVVSSSTESTIKVYSQIVVGDRLAIRAMDANTKNYRAANIYAPVYAGESFVVYYDTNTDVSSESWFVFIYAQGNPSS